MTLAAALPAVRAAPDPSWILSTCAAAAATLLAIVGGFLVAQLIALVSDQHAADARLRDARQTRNTAAERLASLTEELRRAASQALLSDPQLATLVAVRGSVPAREGERCAAATALLAELPAADRQQSISAAVGMLAKIRMRAISALISIVPITAKPDSWEKFNWEHFRLPADEEAQWRAVYNIIAAQRAIEAAELSQPGGPPRSVSGEIEYRFFGSSADPKIGALNGAAEIPDSARETLSSWRQAAIDAQAAAAAEEVALLRRKELIPPREFAFGVWVLGYLAIAVLLPLIVLATGPQSFNFISRYVVPASLAAGVGLLIAFFVHLSAKTRQQAESLLSTGRADTRGAFAGPAVHGDS